MVLTAAFFLFDALWIPAKAELAQVLLESAWRRTLAGEPDARPWPWADTRPLGALSAPRMGERRFVLEGASGRNLAFGPAAITPLDEYDVVISGHRDTHFEFLRRLRKGDELVLRNTSGVRTYRVAWTEVVDSRTRELVLVPGRARLTLVTCFPFDAPTAGGPLRYVVTALPVPDGLDRDSFHRRGAAVQWSSRSGRMDSVPWQ
ncbi:MAG: class GN sortase [Xanthomonadales bacterium]|nr:class GN sortase [Xanthomonadales bacterium]NIX12487.1 class GN sortase [Xanthomonadales bacterium]